MPRASEPLTYIGPGGEEEDGALAQAAAAGDRQALEQLFHRYEPKVVPYLQRLVRDDEVGVDLFQDAFFRAWANLSSYDSRHPFHSWFYRIATNIAIDWMRRRARLLPADEPTPEQPVPTLVAQRDKARRIEQAVTQLRQEQQTVFILRQYQGLSYADIADITDSPEGTVRSRMHYALRFLRERLRYLVEEGEPQ